MNGRPDPRRSKRGLPGPARLLPLLLAGWALGGAAACAGGSAGDGSAGPVAAGPDAHTAAGPRTTGFRDADYARVIHVSAAAPGNADGSAERPFATIGAALRSAAAAAADGRVAVRVSAGTYAEPTIEMRPGIDLLGGFEADGWERDVERHRTVLDGEGERRIVRAAADSRIDGFVLRNGVVRGHGGAILADGVSPTISNNVFEANRTLGPEGWAPEYWHETAHDGGAVACRNGCSAVVENNLFAGNETEIGRGAGFACDNEATKDARAEPRVAGNVFVANVSSAGRFGADTMRSGDGGAISFYGYCDGSIVDNVVAMNVADSKNDGGGVFVALWSSPTVARNRIVGNFAGDDAGGLFVGGQKHHYDGPKEPVPPAEEFFVTVIDNVLAGNENDGGASGGFRVTMMTRGVLYNNIVVGSAVAARTQRSEVTLNHNTILGLARHEDEERTAPGPTIWRNNLIVGEREWLAPLTDESPECADPRFVDDGSEIDATGATYDPDRHLTRVDRRGGDEPEGLAGRVVRAGDRWSVVRSSGPDGLWIWGDVSGEATYAVQPTWHLSPDSPCVDRGVPVEAPEEDIDGDPRTIGEAPDLGADEVANDETTEGNQG